MDPARNYVVNPLTGRLIKVGGPIYRRLVKQCKREETQELLSSNAMDISPQPQDGVQENKTNTDTKWCPFESTNLDTIAAAQFLEDHHDTLMGAFQNPDIDLEYVVKQLLSENKNVVKE
jgi:hypothetical protein